MEAQKPQSVETIGLIVSVFSALIIFSNGMGAFAFTIIGFGSSQSGQNDKLEFNIIEYLFQNFVYLCLFMVAIGILYLIGGLYIRQYKLWANKLVTYLSIFLIAIIWALMIVMSFMMAGQDEMKIFSVGPILNAVFWSSPIVALIWFLNKQAIKQHFV